MAEEACIAIVDDDESMRRSLGRLLEQEGFQTVLFASAEEYLADPRVGEFSCLLADVQLGGMSGIAMHCCLIGRRIRTPVIYITAHDEPAVRHDAVRLGCAGFFRKTDAGPDIIAAIRRVTPSRDPG